MAELSFGAKTVNLDAIEDRQVRQALTEYHEQVVATLGRQQMEIETLLEVLIDNHLTSLGEIKQRLQRPRVRTSIGDRLHEAVTVAMGQGRSAAAPSPGASR